jgi:hypothetical protein
MTERPARGPNEAGDLNEQNLDNSKIYGSKAIGWRAKFDFDFVPASL